MRLLREGPQGLREGESFDLVVVGAGGAGMACALFAALEGAKVLLVERTGLVGGTTAWSAGTTWVPGTHQAARVNPEDSLDEARRYLDKAVGVHAPAALREAFLRHGAAAVQAAESASDLRFRPYPRHPDYLSELGGSTLAGRALEPLPFDGRQLGALFALVRPPIPEFTVLGGMMVDRADINHLLGMRRSLVSLRHALGLLARHAVDRLSHPRGTRLVMGNALVGRLLLSLSKRATVTLALATEVEAIERVEGDENGRVGRVLLSGGGARRSVQATRGVVLASGGFNRDPVRRTRLAPGIPLDWCPGAPGGTGQAHALAEALGARYREGAMSHAFFAPVSLRRRPDGSTAVFPHFVMDRAKPGMIVVDGRGRRFLNESTSYHLFGLAMQAAHRQAPSIPAYLVCDAQALRKYGLGMVRPGGRGLEPYLADGYLVTGATLDELAERLGIDAAGLQASVEQMNHHAETGHDPDFHRGETAYQRNLGDATWTGPNPNLGPLRTAPFYAVRLYPGDIGAATGLATDEHARVLDAEDRPIPGLYAVGNDMQSVMGGVYPAPGITLGPGLVFAWLAARQAMETGGAAA
jgi:succinate dehydrogenase/fumarate reductase flavoprotein subunit